MELGDALNMLMLKLQLHSLGSFIEYRTLAGNRFADFPSFFGNALLPTTFTFLLRKFL